MWRGAKALGSWIAFLLLVGCCTAALQLPEQLPREPKGKDYSLDTKVAASCDSPQLTYEGDPVDFSVRVSAKLTNDSSPPLFSVSRCSVIFKINDVDTKPIPLKASGKDGVEGTATYRAKSLPVGIATVVVRVEPFQVKDMQTGDIWGYRSSSSQSILHVVMPKPEPPPPANDSDMASTAAKRQSY